MEIFAHMFQPVKLININQNHLILMICTHFLLYIMGVLYGTMKCKHILKPWNFQKYEQILGALLGGIMENV